MRATAIAKLCRMLVGTCESFDEKPNQCPCVLATECRLTSDERNKFRTRTVAFCEIDPFGYTISEALS